MCEKMFTNLTLQASTPVNIRLIISELLKSHPISSVFSQLILFCTQLPPRFIALLYHSYLVATATEETESFFIVYLHPTPRGRKGRRQRSQRIYRKPTSERFPRQKGCKYEAQKFGFRMFDNHISKQKKRLSSRVSSGVGKTSFREREDFKILGSPSKSDSFFTLLQ